MRTSKTVKRRFLLIACMLCIFLLATAVTTMGASGTAKKLTAIFRNIQLNVDGRVLQAEEEPFIINGRTYVPLRVIGEALGVSVGWNGNTSVVSIGANGDLKSLRLENEQLKKQVEGLQKKLAEEVGSAPDIEVLGEKVKENFSSLDGVKFDEVAVLGDNEETSVSIKVDLKTFDDEWLDLRDSEIRNLLSDICEVIQVYYSLDNDVAGTVKELNSNATLIQFRKNGKLGLSVSFLDEDYRGPNIGEINAAEDELKGKTYSVEDIEFELDKPDYHVKNHEIDAFLRATTVGAKAKWEKLATSDMEGIIYEVCEEIVDSFMDSDYVDSEMINLKAYDEAGVLLDSFEYDVDDEDLDW